MSQKPEDAASRARKRLAHQRRALRHLNKLHREKRFEAYVRAVKENFGKLDAATRALTHVMGDEPWNAGMRHGMRLARDLMNGRPDVSDVAIDFLDNEIGWRFYGKPRP